GAGRGRRVRTPGRSTAARASRPVPSGGPREPEAGCPASVQPRGSTSSYESVVRLEQFLHAGLVLRDLLARLSPRHREQNLAAESVTCEVDRDRELRPRAVSDRLDPDRSVCPDRSVEHPERRLPRRVVLGDLVGHRAVASRHAPCFLHTRADPERSVVLGLHGDDLFLPFAMAFDVVEVREHLLGPSVDLDALADRRHPCLLLRTIEPDPRCSGPGGSIRNGEPQPPATDPTVHVSIARRKTLNSGGILPLAIGIPALLSALLVGSSAKAPSRLDSTPLLALLSEGIPALRRRHGFA